MEALKTLVKQKEITNCTHLPSSFHLINTRNKKVNLRFPQCPYFVQLQQKEELTYYVGKANTCD